MGLCLIFVPQEFWQNKAEWQVQSYSHLTLSALALHSFPRNRCCKSHYWEVSCWWRKPEWVTALLAYRSCGPRMWSLLGPPEKPPAATVIEQAIDKQESPSLGPSLSPAHTHTEILGTAWQTECMHGNLPSLSSKGLGIEWLGWVPVLAPASDPSPKCSRLSWHGGNSPALSQFLRDGIQWWEVLSEEVRIWSLAESSCEQA